MLKKFLLNVLAAITGFWISMVLCILLVFGLIVMLIGGLMSGDTTVSSVKNGSVLCLTLQGDLNERASTDDISINELFTGSVNGPSLQDLLAAIRAAKGDKRIRGMLLDCQGLSGGAASLQELTEALADYRKSGKWLMAYSDDYQQGEYYLASGADAVYLNPRGTVNLRGLSGSVPFFKTLMDRLGIKMQVFKVGTFKSAVEPFLLTQMSEPSRLQTSTYLDGIWAEMTQHISQARGISSNQLTLWTDSMLMSYPTTRYQAMKVITKTAYRREVDDLIRSRLGLKKDADIPYVSLQDYIAANSDIYDTNPDRDHIALLYAVGDIVDSGKSGIVGPIYVQQILDLAKDEHVKGLVLRVNSGGGSAFASEQIWDALEQFKKTGKPFYVSMGDMAASGGYYISCGADSIMADATTLTGSIGIFGTLPDIQGLVEDKIGVNFSTVSTSPNAAFPNIFAPVTPYQRDVMQRNVEEGYDLFTRRVAQGRHISQDSVKVIAEGRVWYGRDALRIGLVDRLTSMQGTLLAMARKTHLTADKWVAYPAEKVNPWKQIVMTALNDQSYEEAVKMLKSTPALAEGAKAMGIDLRSHRAVLAYMQLVQRLMTPAPLQAQCERIHVSL